MLQNRIYRGEIVHKEKSYPGEHKAILDNALWEEVQRRLETNRTERASGADAAQPSLLAGLIYDDAGERMTPSHANKKGTRYRYYVSQALVRGNRRAAPRGRRVPAGDLEGLVEDRLRQFLMSETEVFDAMDSIGGDVAESPDLIARARDLAGRWPKTKPSEKRSVLMTLGERIDLMRETLEIRILPRRLPSILGDENNWSDMRRSANETEPSITFSVPARLKRVGMETRLLIDGTGAGARTGGDHSLCRLLAQAHQYRALVMRNGGRTMVELAAEAGVGGSYFSRILRLSFLAPDVTKMILRDRQPIGLTARRLASDTRLPIAWEDQRALLEKI